MMEGKETGQFANQEKGGVNKKQEPIELLYCPLKEKGSICIEHRAVINQSMLASRRHLMNKEYQVSIEELKIAFNKTTELQEATCQKCANFFRSTITQSMEQIHEDLRKMTTGFFKAKRFLPTFELANEVLAEFKKQEQD
jgi:hypothetical protein